MRLPFRTLHVVPAKVCVSLGCLPQVLDEPILHTVQVLDPIGLPEAFDLQMTQGFFVLLLAYAATRLVMNAVVTEIVRRRAETNAKHEQK